MAYGKFVSYLRVSTARQGISGLGLEAQREAVASYLNGGRWSLVQEVVEVESGKRNDRPAIAEALRLCRLHRATLIIAKLDRLARNVHFISSLMEFGVEFIAADFPQANRLTVHILAAVAEHEVLEVIACEPPRTPEFLVYLAHSPDTIQGQKPGQYREAANPSTQIRATAGLIGEQLESHRGRASSERTFDSNLWDLETNS